LQSAACTKPFLDETGHFWSKILHFQRFIGYLWPKLNEFKPNNSQMSVKTKSMSDGQRLMTIHIKLTILNVYFGIFDHYKHIWIFFPAI